jgi:hypothetical protein
LRPHEMAPGVLGPAVAQEARCGGVADDQRSDPRGK